MRNQDKPSTANTIGQDDRKPEPIVSYQAHSGEPHNWCSAFKNRERTVCSQCGAMRQGEEIIRKGATTIRKEERK